MHAEDTAGQTFVDLDLTSKQQVGSNARWLHRRHVLLSFAMCSVLHMFVESCDNAARCAAVDIPAVNNNQTVTRRVRTLNVKYRV
jgi:hypothetical protein